MIQLFRPKYEIEECLKNIRGVLESGWTGPGPQCKAFEEEFNSFTGAKYSHFVNSATSALHIAVRCLNLLPGSTILTSPLTFVSTNAVILYEGHIPVFVDVNPDDLSLDYNDFIKKAEGYNAGAAIWVHHSGHTSDDFEFALQTIKKDKPGFSIIEDCAHAMGTTYSTGKRVGSREDTISCFSFQAVKNLPSADSGMICVPNENMLARVKRLAWLGIDKDTYARTNQSEKEVYKWMYDVPELGWKYNGNDIVAAIARAQLKVVDRDNAYRKQIYYWYKTNFDSCSEVNLIRQCIDSSHHLVVIRVKNRDEVMAHLKAAGIAPGVHYLPNYKFPIFSKFYSPGDCPNTEMVSQEIISLPNHMFLTKNDVDKISEVVINAARY